MRCHPAARCAMRLRNTPGNARHRKASAKIPRRAFVRIDVKLVIGASVARSSITINSCDRYTDSNTECVTI